MTRKIVGRKAVKSQDRVYIHESDRSTLGGWVAHFVVSDTSSYAVTMCIGLFSERGQYTLKQAQDLLEKSTSVGTFDIIRDVDSMKVLQRFTVTKAEANARVAANQVRLDEKRIS